MSWLEKIGLRSSAQSISPEEAHQLQQSGKLTIVDVRDPSEWAATGIPLDSHGISLEDTNFIGLVNVLKARNPGVRMALSCKTGMRAKSAARLIQKDNGHQPLIVSGGIGAWKKAGLPVETV